MNCLRTVILLIALPCIAGQFGLNGQLAVKDEVAANSQKAQFVNALEGNQAAAATKLAAQDANQAAIKVADQRAAQENAGVKAVDQASLRKGSDLLFQNTGFNAKANDEKLAFQHNAGSSDNIVINSADFDNVKLAATENRAAKTDNKLDFAFNDNLGFQAVNQADVFTNLNKIDNTAAQAKVAEDQRLFFNDNLFKNNFGQLGVQDKFQENLGFQNIAQIGVEPLNFGLFNRNFLGKRRRR